MSIPTVNMKNSSIYGPKVDICPLCKAHALRDLYTISAFKNPFTVSQCKECEFIFMNPRFAPNILESLYNKEYYSGTADYSYVDERRLYPYAMRVWKKRIECLRRIKSSGNFLDIGASFGGLMDAAKTYFTPYGIEISDYSASHAQQRHGKRIHHGTLNDHPYKKDFFAAITMIEVIEHLEDPMKAIQECYNILEKGGVLCIQTANMDGMQAKKLGSSYNYYMPGHLSYFSQKTLRYAFKKAGFSHMRFFFPVEFGLLPKLLKSRGSFSSPKDYKNWIRITLYHLLGKIHWRNFSATSSMVVYAIK